MARSILDIVIKLSKQGGADQETVKGLVQVKSAIMDAAAVAGTLVAAGYTIKKAFDATVGTFVEYADQVRSVAQLSGLSAEESSRLIQVADDLKISFEDLQKVMQKNGDQYDYSVNGLAAMSDQYMKLETSQEKAAFMQERFGKSWGNFVELMEQGSSRIQAAGEGINDALILDQKALDQAREYEKQVDNLSDSLMAYKVTIGGAVLPALNDMMTVENRVIQLMEEGLNPYEARRQATQELMAATQELTSAEAENSSAVQQLNMDYGEVVKILGQVVNSQEDYSKKVQEVNADVTLSDEERIAKLTQLKLEYQKATTEIVAANMLQIMSQDGLTQAEFARYAAFMEGTGLMEAGAAQQAIALNNLATAAANGTMSVDQLKAAIAGLENKTVTLSVNTIYSTYGDTAAVVGQTGKGARRAHGTDGWETVPSGFPNDSYPVWMTSGEKYAVMPTGGGNVSTAGGGGYAGGVNLTVNINSMINTADREKVRSEMLPVIQDAVRSLQAQGMI